MELHFTTDYQTILEKIDQINILMPNICHISTDGIGGAARAAYRIHRALSAENNNESRMIVRSKTDD